MKKLILTLFFAVPALSALYSATIVVRNNPASGEYATISEAVKKAADGDVIDILGLFTESGIIVRKSITLQGHGVDKTIVQGNQQKPTAENIAEMKQMPVFVIGDNSKVVEAKVSIKNLAIRNGVSAAEGNGTQASGVVVYKMEVAFDKVLFEDNYSLDKQTGGAMYVVGATVMLDNCFFKNNSAGLNGGAIYAVTSGAANTVLTIANSSFVGNSSREGHGGALAFDGSVGGQGGKHTSVRIENSTFFGNSTKQHGGGIYAKGPRLKNEGAGFGDENGFLKLVVNHCTIVGNMSQKPTKQATGICFDEGGNGSPLFELNNSIVMGNYIVGTTPDNTTSPQIGANSLKVQIAEINNAIFTTQLSGFKGMNNLTKKAFSDLKIAKELSNDFPPFLSIAADSPAKDMVVVNKAKTAKDQRGVARDKKPDAGAFEVK